MPAATSLEDIYHNATSDLHEGNANCCSISIGSNAPPSPVRCNFLSSSYSPSTTLSHYFNTNLYLNQQYDEDQVFKKLLKLANTKLNDSNTINCDVLNYNHHTFDKQHQRPQAPNRQQQQYQQSQTNSNSNSSSNKLRTQSRRTDELLIKQQQEQPFRSSRWSSPKMTTSYRNSKTRPSQSVVIYHEDELSTSSAPDSISSERPSGAQADQSQHYLTIEELRSALNSCWLCGCNWSVDHLSLDCPECGGYSMTRPCLKCDGKCPQLWKRNINATHDHHKALWTGECALEPADELHLSEPKEDEAGPQLASSLCSSSTSSSSSEDFDDDCPSSCSGEHEPGLEKAKSTK